MIKTFELSIIIPCYNEQDRLDLEKINSFFSINKNILICLVDDGSNDKTLETLNEIKDTHPNNIEVLALKKNVGKGGAVRKGFNHCISKIQQKKIAYLDADFATSLEECFEISKLVNKETVFVFGSRIRKIDTNIERNYFRFLVGRIIATIISNQLNLGVYDTQCGCKIFEIELAKKLFKEKFISKWLFDVELFHRMIKIFGFDKMREISKEIPLKNWIDNDESRVIMTYFFKLWFDLFSIGRHYKKN